jgi:hypothetical protein
MAEGELRTDSGGPGDWKDDLATLRILDSFTVPLPTEHSRERERWRESGTLTREVIARLLAGEFW